MEYLDAIIRVSDLFSGQKYDEAESLLQECINLKRVDTLKFMEHLRDTTTDQEVKDRLVRLYFFNHV